MSYLKRFFFSLILLICAAAAIWGRREISWSIAWLRKPNLSAQPSAMPRLEPCAGCNVILISLDTLRADHLGFLGSSQKLTPNLDKIASRSVVFRQFFANAFYTTPSHMTLFTSLYPDAHMVEARNFKVPNSQRTSTAQSGLDKRYQTIAELFQAAGYKTAWAGPQRLKHLEFSLGFGRGFQKSDESIFHRQVDRLIGRDEFPVKRFEELLRTPNPFFLFLHSYTAHLPYVDDSISDTQIIYQGERLLEEFTAAIREDALQAVGYFNDADDSVQWPPQAIAACGNRKLILRCFEFIGRQRFWNALGQWQQRNCEAIFKGSNKEREVAASRQSYAKQVQYLDQQIGEMWKELERAGVLKNTIVVFVSDHGEELGEHGAMSHTTFYDHNIRIPLMIVHPAQTERVDVEVMGSVVDVLPTILGLVGLPAPDQAQGMNLAKVKEDQVIFGEALDNDFVRTREWKLIRNYRGEESLFNLNLDPDEKNNLIDLKIPWVRKAYEDLRRRRDYWKLGQGI